MAQYQFPVVYAPGGINYSLPSTLRSLRNARDGLNFDITATQHLTKRCGWQYKATSAGGYGLAVQEKRVLTTVDVDGFGAFAFGVDAFGSPTTLGYGTITNNLVALDDLPLYWTYAEPTLLYSGTGSATVTISAVSGGYIQMDLSVDGSSVYSKNLGTGLEGSPVTLSTVDTEVDALSDWTMTLPTGTSSVPAAFLHFQNTQALTKDVDYALSVGYWTEVNSPMATPLPKITERLSQEDYENATTASVNGNLYITNGFDPVCKYDGQNLYYAGLPAPTTAPTESVDTLTSVGATFTGTWNYRYTYEQKDSIGNILESPISSDSDDSDNSAGPYAIDVTVTNLIASSGYNTNCAIVDGTQTSTNVSTSTERLTLDDGSGGDHTLKVGDTAYLYDINTTSYRELEVLAVTGSTADFRSASTISVADNQVISAGLKINIYRAEVVAGVDPAQSDYGLITQLPNNSFASTQSYKDETIPANVGASYIPPLKTGSTPPACKYITLWRNQLILAGDPNEPMRLYYSEFADVTNPENFPALNFKDIPQGGGGRITGIAALDRNIFIFTQSRVYVGEGNLAEDSLRVDLVSDQIGCVAHATIQSVDGSLFFLSEKGVYRLYRKSSFFAIEKVSQPLDPVFEPGANNTFRNSYKRATAQVWSRENRYMLFLPAETTAAGVRYNNSNSRVFVLDIDSGEWYLWSNLSCGGGLVEWDDGEGNTTLWFHSRGAAGANYLARLNTTGAEIDFVDHTSAIAMSYKPQWDFQQSPSTSKIYNDIGLDSFIGSAQLPYTPSGQITLDLYRDFNETTSDCTFTVDMPSDDQQLVEPLPRRHCRALGLEFSNEELNKNILIAGWSFEVMQLISHLRPR